MLAPWPGGPLSRLERRSATFPVMPQWASTSVPPTLILVPRKVEVPMLTEVSEYTGQRAIAVSCTQLGTGFTSSRARRVVDEWIKLLSSPTPLTELRLSLIHI